MSDGYCNCYYQEVRAAGRPPTRCPPAAYTAHTTPLPPHKFAGCCTLVAKSYSFALGAAAAYIAGLASAVAGAAPGGGRRLFGAAAGSWRSCSYCRLRCCRCSRRWLFGRAIGRGSGRAPLSKLTFSSSCSRGDFYCFHLASCGARSRRWKAAQPRSFE